MRFSKYHGLGNDFLVVDLRGARSQDAEAAQDPQVVRALCDRQFGVGGDGVLAVLPPLDNGADARMRVLNADGSEAEMCGNGIRCVAKELFDRGGVKKDTIAIDTGAGRLVCAITAKQGITETVTVDMGAPRLKWDDIPVSRDHSHAEARERATFGVAHRTPAPRANPEHCIDETFPVPGYPSYLFTCVSMGNPHAITFVDAGEPQRLATTLGPIMEKHPRFPRRTNVEFAHAISPREIELVVWERGSGLTLACGTGACATAVAAILTGRAEEGSEIVVRLPGGPLAITVERGLSTVKMRGPALHVFDGELDPRHVAPRP